MTLSIEEIALLYHSQNPHERSVLLETTIDTLNNESLWNGVLSSKIDRLVECGYLIRDRNFKYKITDEGLIQFKKEAKDLQRIALFLNLGNY